MSENTKEYKEYYVAFLDILGFKEMIAKQGCDEIYSLYETIKEASDLKFSFNDQEVEVFNSVHYIIMSDSIVLYIDSSLEDSFTALLFTCQHLQIDLLKRPQPILLRGGISKGELFVDEEKNIIFGKALTSAYLLENGIAKYPRIVFNKELLEEGKTHNVEMPNTLLDLLIVEKDDDELFYINFVTLLLSENEKSESIPQYIDHILTFTQKELDSVYDSSIREKYLWLKKATKKVMQRFRSHIPHWLPNGDDLFGKWK